MRRLLGPPFVLVAASLLVMGATARSAAAQTAAADRPIRMEYRAFPGCPTGGVLLADVGRRVGGVRLARPGEAAPALVISLWAHDGRVTGRLVLDRGDAPPGTRDVSADSCEQAVAALAFVVALSLDPDAATASPEAVPRAVSPSVRADVRPTWSVVAGGQSSFAIAPTTAFGVFAAGEFAGLLGPLRPSLRLTGSFLGSGTTEIGPLAASFRSASGRLDVCPSSTKLSIVRLSVCAGLELGSLRAEGRGVDLPVAEARLWSVAHALGRARLEPTSRVFVEVEAGAAFPLTARRFRFENPTIEVFATPPIAFAGALGVGLSFP